VLPVPGEPGDERHPAQAGFPCHGRQAAWFGAHKVSFIVNYWNCLCHGILSSRLTFEFVDILWALESPGFDLSDRFGLARSAFFY
jgi:hypothetical protein